MTPEAPRTYDTWLNRAGLSRYPERNPIVGWMRRVDELDALIDRAEEQISVAHDPVSRRRAERKHDRLETERLRIHELIDAYDPSATAQLLIYEELLQRAERPRTAPGPSGFSPAPAHPDQTDEEV